MDSFLPQSGAQLGQYVIQDEIGFGTSGYVYRAQHIASGKLVALKLLRPENLADAANHSRFEREMEICFKLSHPNIVHLIETIETDDGTPCAVFEYIKGETLQNLLIKEHHLSVEETCHLMRGILDGLVCAHENGIVHRDIKPSNIIISQTGKLRNGLILDFGLGGITDDFEQNWQKLTHAGEYMGTPLYSPREQWEGLESARPEWDIFGWSLIFLECLMGEHPSGGELPATGKVRIPEFLELHPLGALLAKAVSKDPAERDVTSDELFAAITAAAHEVKNTEISSPIAGRRKFVSVLAVRFNVTRKEGVDAEDVSQFSREFIDICKAEAHQLGGSLVSSLGGSALIVFGHPRVHENDAKRAARCGFRLLERAETLNQSSSMQVSLKIGMHSGPVLSNHVGEEEQLELVGETFDAAARLDAAGSEGDFIVSSTSMTLLQNQIDLLRAIPVDSENAYLIAERSGAQDSGDAREQTPFIGRTLDMAQLEDAWSRAKSGQAQSRLLIGEAGIGKSRLVHELKNRIDDTNWMETRCLPEKQSNPMEPIIELLKGNLDRLKELIEVGEILTPDQSKLLQNLLEGNAPTEGMAMTSQKAREMTMQIFVSLSIALCEKEPTVLLIEDLHWADPSTLQLISYFEVEIGASAAEGQQLPLLLVCTSRQSVGVNTPVIDVSKLSSEEMKELINSRITLDVKPSNNWINSVIERGDGIPLFIEEVVKLMEQGGAAPDPSKSLRVPVTLSGLLNERIDSISPSALLVAQYASALGRQFSFAHLNLASGFTSSVLQKHLASLVETGLVFERRTTVERKYIFKHALVRDAVYESMLKSTRLKVHQSIADVLLNETHAGRVAQPAVLATHLREAGRIEESCTWAIRASNQAVARAAYEEASTVLSEALNVIGKIENEETRQLMELELLEALGTVQYITLGFDAPPVRKTFERAKQITDILGEEVSPRVLSGIWMGQINQGNETETRQTLKQLKAIAERFDDPVSHICSDLARTTWDYYYGDLNSCLHHAEKAISLHHHEEVLQYIQQYGDDISVHAYTYRMDCLNIMGQPGKAKEEMQQILDRAKSTGNPYHWATALAYCICMLRDQRDLELTEELSRELLTHSQEQSLMGQMGTALCTHGWARCMLGDKEGRSEIEQGLEFMTAVGMKVSRSFQSSALAEVDLLANKLDLAIQTCDEGIKICDETIDKVFVWNLYLIKAVALYKKGMPEEAEQFINLALERADIMNAMTAKVRILADWYGMKESLSQTEAVLLKDSLDKVDQSLDLSYFKQARDILASAAH